MHPVHCVVWGASQSGSQNCEAVITRFRASNVHLQVKRIMGEGSYGELHW